MAEKAALQERFGVNELPDNLKKVENGKLILPPTVHIGDYVYRLYNSEGSQYSNTIRINPNNSDRYVYVLEEGSKEESQEPTEQERVSEEPEASQTQEPSEPLEDNEFDFTQDAEEEQLQKEDPLTKDVDKIKESIDNIPEGSKSSIEEKINDTEQEAEEQPSKEKEIEKVIARTKVALEVRSFFKDFFGVEMENFASRLPALKRKYGDFAVTAGLNEYYGAIIGIYAKNIGIELNSAQDLADMLASMWSEDVKSNLWYKLKDSLEALGFSSRRAANMVDNFFKFAADASVQGLLNAFSAHHTSHGIYSAFKYYQSIPDGVEVRLSDLNKETFENNVNELKLLHQNQKEEKEVEKLLEAVNEYSQTPSNEDLEEEIIPTEAVRQKAREYAQKVLNSDYISKSHIQIARANLVDVDTGKPVFNTKKISDTIKFAIHEVSKHRRDEQFKDELSDINFDFIDMLKKAENGDFSSLIATKKALASMLGNKEMAGLVSAESIGNLLDNVISQTGIFSTAYEPGVNTLKVAQEKLNLAGIALFAAKNNLPLGVDWTESQYKELAEFLADNMSLASAFTKVDSMSEEDLVNFLADYVSSGASVAAKYAALVRDEEKIISLKDLDGGLPTETSLSEPQPVEEKTVDEAVKETENLLEDEEPEEPQRLEEAGSVSIDYKGFSVNSPDELEQKLLDGEDIQFSAKIDGKDVELTFKFKDGFPDNLEASVKIDGVDIFDGFTQVPEEFSVKIFENLLDVAGTKPPKAVLDNLNEDAPEEVKRLAYFSGAERKLGYTLLDAINTFAALKDADEILSENMATTIEEEGQKIGEELDDIAKESIPEEQQEQETTENEPIVEEKAQQEEQVEPEQNIEQTQEAAEENTSSEEQQKEKPELSYEAKEFLSTYENMPEDEKKETYINYRQGKEPILTDTLRYLSDNYKDLKLSHINKLPSGQYTVRFNGENIVGDTVSEVFDEVLNKAEELSAQGKIDKDSFGLMQRAKELNDQYKKEANSQRYEISDNTVKKYLDDEGAEEWASELLDEISRNFDKLKTEPSKYAQNKIVSHLVNIVSSLHNDGVIPGNIRVYHYGDNTTLAVGKDKYEGKEAIDKALELIGDHYDRDTYENLKGVIDNVLYQTEQYDKEYKEYRDTKEKENKLIKDSSDVFESLLSYARRKKISPKTLTNKVKNTLSELEKLREAGTDNFKKKLDDAVKKWVKINTGVDLDDVDNYQELVPLFLQGFNHIRNVEGLPAIELPELKAEEPKQKEEEKGTKEKPQEQEKKSERTTSVSVPSESNLKAIYNTIYESYLNSDKRPKEGFIARKFKSNLRKALKLDKNAEPPKEVIDKLNEALGTSGSSIDDIASEIADRVVADWETKQREKEKDVGTIEKGKEYLDKFDLGEIKEGIKKMLGELPIPPKAYEDLVKEYGKPADWNKGIFEQFREGIKEQFKNSPNMLETIQTFFPSGFLIEEKPEESEEAEDEKVPDLEDLEGPPEEILDEDIESLSDEELSELEKNTNNSPEENKEEKEKPNEKSEKTEEQAKESNKEDNKKTKTKQKEDEDEDEEDVFDLL